MTSGNTQDAASPNAGTASGNRMPGGRQALQDLPNVYAQAMAEYSGQLRLTPLAPASRTKYLSRVRAYLAWIAVGEASGDPLNEAAARDWAVRDYRRDLKVVRKMAPTTINTALAAIDDFYTRRGLGPAAARREDPPPRDAPKALNNQQAPSNRPLIKRTDKPGDSYTLLISRKPSGVTSCAPAEQNGSIVLMQTR